MQATSYDSFGRQSSRIMILEAFGDGLGFLYCELALRHKRYR